MGKNYIVKIQAISLSKKEGETLVVHVDAGKFNFTFIYLNSLSLFFISLFFHLRRKIDIGESKDELLRHSHSFY